MEYERKNKSRNKKQLVTKVGNNTFNMKYLILVLIIVLIFFGCKNSSSEENIANCISSNLIDSELMIEYDANECGEWGGHRERIKVMSNLISFERTKIDCDSLVRDYKPGDSSIYAIIPYEYIDYSSSTILSHEKEELIYKFVISTFNTRLVEETDYELGFAQGLTSRVRIRNLDSTLIITSSIKKSTKEFFGLVHKLDLLNPNMENIN